MTVKDLVLVSPYTMRFRIKEERTTSYGQCFFRYELFDETGLGDPADPELLDREIKRIAIDKDSCRSMIVIFLKKGCAL